MAKNLVLEIGTRNLHKFLEGVSGILVQIAQKQLSRVQIVILQNSY